MTTHKHESEPEAPKHAAAHKHAAKPPVKARAVVTVNGRALHVEADVPEGFRESDHAARDAALADVARHVRDTCLAEYGPGALVRLGPMEYAYKPGAPAGGDVTREDLEKGVTFS